RISVAVAAAVEQQTAATQDIARNVHENGTAVQDVTQRIAEVSREANVVGEEAGRLRRDSSDIADDITALRGALVRTVRTATTDADRRMERRIDTSEPCSILVGSETSGT